MKKRRPAHRNLTGATIKRLRMEAEPRVTQEDMSARVSRLGLALSQEQIAKIENGQRPVTDIELTAIARALKVHVAMLFE